MLKIEWPADPVFVILASTYLFDLLFLERKLEIEVWTVYFFLDKHFANFNSMVKKTNHILIKERKVFKHFVSFNQIVFKSQLSSSCPSIEKFSKLKHAGTHLGKRMFKYLAPGSRACKER
jgi:hypothetical protein